MDEPLFNVNTVLGFRVRLARSRWDWIVAVKHPVMQGRQADVARALTTPDDVRRSRADPDAYLF